MKMQCLSYSLQGDIAHSEVQDTLIYSAGRTFACMTLLSMIDLVQCKTQFLLRLLLVSSNLLFCQLLFGYCMSVFLWY